VEPLFSGGNNTEILMETVGDLTPKQRYLWIHKDMPEVKLFTMSEGWCMILLDWPITWVQEWRRNNIVNTKNKKYGNN
jgi:hypothetical protein